MATATSLVAQNISVGSMEQLAHGSVYVQEASSLILSSSSLQSMCSSFSPGILQNQLTSAATRAFEVAGGAGRAPVACGDSSGDQHLQVMPEKLVDLELEGKLAGISLSGGAVIDDKVIKVPVIDFSEIEGAEGRARIRGQIHEAASHVGFFQIVNHGVPEALLEKLMENQKRFFELPQEEKEVYRRELVMRAEGYGKSTFWTKKGHTHDVKDSYLLENCYAKLLPTFRRDLSKWPANPISYRETMDAYGRALEKLCKQVLELLAENLGLPTSFINDAMDHQPWLSVRSIHYLRSNGLRAEQVALPAHTDYGALTVIAQERVTHPALQVWKDEEWMSLEQCIPGALFINIDDQIETFTNGAYKSMGHRVLASPNNTRLAIVASYEFPESTKVCPTPALIDEQHPPLYKGFYMQDRMDDVYKRGKPTFDRAIYLIKPDPALVESDRKAADLSL
ncbi:unnamed protein product [Sphagnum troendelagicum]